MLIFKNIPIVRNLRVMAGLLATFCLAQHALAQTTGTCPRSQGEAYLDVGNVRARILNNGGLFYRGEPHVYEVPKGSGSNAIFASSIWLAGLINGTIHAAGTRYGEWEFWPGPLNDIENPPPQCFPYDRLWEITRDDLTTFAETGEQTDNLRDWPWHLGAPVLDGDGNPDNYDLEAGDRPALIGDQMLWWVMNDVGNTHETTRAPPIGMEVHGSAIAFDHPRSFISNTTFYRYLLHYKGERPFEKAYFGIFSDPDLGDFADDYVGSDSMLHLAFVYNSDDLDVSREGYGAAPPALGYTILRSALADRDLRDNNRDGFFDEPGERLGMTSFLFYNGGGCVICDPVRARDYYRYMQALWKDGQPVTVGGNGRDFSDVPTKFMFSGDPVTGAFWSERNADGAGISIDPADRRFVAASGPFTMQPGDTLEILFAIVWSRGRDHLDSIRELKKDVKRLREVAEIILVPDVAFSLPEPLPEPVYEPGIAQNYPNPFSETTTIRYSLPRALHIRLTVFDALGREVATLVDARQAPGLYEVPFDAKDLPAGVYFYRIEMDYASATRAMILTP